MIAKITSLARLLNKFDRKTRDVHTVVNYESLSGPFGYPEFVMPFISGVLAILHHGIRLYVG